MAQAMRHRVEHPDGTTLDLGPFSPHELTHEQVPIISMHLEFEEDRDNSRQIEIVVVYVVAKPVEDPDYYGCLIFPKEPS